MIHADFRVPALDYETLLKVTQVLTKKHKEVEKMYRLACFNVLAHNRDDHSKNFSFLFDKDYCWRLSPAYDLTFSYGPNKEQSTMVMGEGSSPRVKHLNKLAEKFQLSNAKQILQEVITIVSNWHHFANEAGVSQKSTQMIARAINKSLSQN